jgi:A/G-specific adenine glycosylase
MKFSKLLIQWYLQNKRDLPWRNTKDPYRILRNHVTTDPCRSGNPYFLSFVDPLFLIWLMPMKKQVLKLWQGLGYYSRARNLHKTAQYIANEKVFFP